MRILGRLLLMANLGGMGFLAMAQPSNDNFANRETIVQTTISGTLAGATAENGEPFFDGLSTGQTAWWTWTAPSNGIVTLQINGTGFNPFLAVYTGNALENLSLMASNNYLACYEHAECGCNWRVRNFTTFHVQQGQSYQIGVDSALFTDSSYSGSFVFAQLIIPNGGTNGEPLVASSPVTRTTNVLAGGDVRLQFQFTPAPENDDFAQRIKLRGSTTRTQAANFGATQEAGEPLHLGNSGGSSVWYSWAAPASGRVTLSTTKIAPYAPPSWWYSYGGFWSDYVSFVVGFNCGKEIDQNPPPQFFPLFAAYTGDSVDSLASANALPMMMSEYPYAVEFDVVKGQSYQIAFDGNQGTTGETPMHLALTKRAINDDFNRRIKMHGIDVFAMGHNAGATHQLGEPAPTGNSTGKTVWWSWLAPVSGTVSIDTANSDHSFNVTVFTGASLSKLVPVAAGTNSFLFEATAHQTYQIAVSDAAGLTGAIKFHLQAPVVEVPLLRKVQSSFQAALLRYAASPGQVMLLQRWDSNGFWKTVRKATAHRNTVEFFVKPAPITDILFYRAIIVDDISR